jgi:xylose dehydrogenase (NAD/NADP)
MVSGTLRVGVLGAAWIADRAMLPALNKAGNAVPVAIASRDASRAREMARRHGVDRVHDSYQALVDDPDVDAVYVALINSLHAEWTLRALRAGKHVLCEKPLGMSAQDARAMAAGAQETGKTLMEAFMYRFHPRILELRASVGEIRFLHAGFSFLLSDAANYRMQPALGGGALLDVGCYTLDIARWFLGEPQTVHAAMRRNAVDTSVIAVLGFAGGGVATAFASFDAPEYQELVLVDSDGLRRVPQPFTAWRDPHDPYQLMVEAFASSVLTGSPAPLSLTESIATAELTDRVRAAALLHDR